MGVVRGLRNKIFCITCWKLIKKFKSKIVVKVNEPPSLTNEPQAQQVNLPKSGGLSRD